jgi:uncharacterized protein (DUF302 family)
MSEGCLVTTTENYRYDRAGEQIRHNITQDGLIDGEIAGDSDIT